MMGARAARDEGAVPMGRQTQAATSRLPLPNCSLRSFPLARTSGQLELLCLQLLLLTAHPRRPLPTAFLRLKRPQPAARAASQPTHERRRAVRDRVRLGELLNRVGSCPCCWSFWKAAKSRRTASSPFCTPSAASPPRSPARCESSSQSGSATRGLPAFSFPSTRPMKPARSAAAPSPAAAAASVPPPPAAEDVFAAADESPPAEAAAACASAS